MSTSRLSGAGAEQQGAFPPRTGAIPSPRPAFPPACLAEHEGKPLRFFSANNTLKTYYGPLLLRPVSFLRRDSAGDSW